MKYIKLNNLVYLLALTLTLTSFNSVNNHTKDTSHQEFDFMRRSRTFTLSFKKNLSVEEQRNALVYYRMKCELLGNQIHLDFDINYTITYPHHSEVFYATVYGEKSDLDDFQNEIVVDTRFDLARPDKPTDDGDGGGWNGDDE